MSIADIGLLSDEAAHRYSEKPALAPSFDLAKEFVRLAHRLATIPRDVDITGNLSDPRVIATLLLFRALGNAQSVILLCDRGLLVDGRNATRSLAECALHFIALKKDPTHYAAMAGDELSSRKGRDKLMLGFGGQLSPEQISVVRKHLDQIDAQGKLRKIELSEVGKMPDADIHYLIYRQLSADAAHVSLESISRYLNYSPAGEIESVTILPTDMEPQIGQTTAWACNFLMLCLVMFIEHIPDSEADKALMALFERYKAIVRLLH